MTWNQIEEAAKLHADLLALVKNDRDRVLQVADRIQRIWRTNKDLTALCNLNGGMQVRRLLSVAHRNWGIVEINWCKEVLSSIARLKDDPSPRATLALACWGYYRNDLERLLEQAERGETPAEKRPQIKKSKQAPAVAPAQADETDELDPETLKGLKDLEAEVRSLTGNSD